MLVIKEFIKCIIIFAVICFKVIILEMDVLGSIFSFFLASLEIEQGPIMSYGLTNNLGDWVMAFWKFPQQLLNFLGNFSNEVQRWFPCPEKDLQNIFMKCCRIEMVQVSSHWQSYANSCNFSWCRHWSRWGGGKIFYRYR